MEGACWLCTRHQDVTCHRVCCSSGRIEFLVTDWSSHGRHFSTKINAAHPPCGVFSSAWCSICREREMYPLVSSAFSSNCVEAQEIFQLWRLLQTSRVMRDQGLVCNAWRDVKESTVPLAEEASSHRQLSIRVFFERCWSIMCDTTW